MVNGEEKRRGSLAVCPGTRLSIAFCRHGTDGIPAVSLRPDVACDLFPISSILSITSCNACKRNPNSFLLLPYCMMLLRNPNITCTP